MVVQLFHTDLSETQCTVKTVGNGTNTQPEQACPSVIGLRDKLLQVRPLKTYQQQH